MTNKQPKIGDGMKYYLYSLFLLIVGTTVAQSEIKATVDRQDIYFGESLSLTIVSDQNTNSQPDFSILEAVFHVGQTSKSSSTQIINGSVSTQTTWQVLLVPKSMGSHIIPPIEVDGERTQTIKIEVKKPDPNAQAKGDIFIEIETNKTSAYVQEEILLTVRLLYAINLKNGALTEPSADGVIVQQINKGTNYTTQRDGRNYQVLERKYAIFVENSGPLSLNPLVFEGEVTDSNRPSYGLFQRGRPIRQVSEMLELDIKQIPQAFVNKAWMPAKQITLTQSWSQDQPYRVGEPITRTINLTAVGLSETQLPDLEFSDIQGAKIYQDKTDTMTRTDGQQLIATKTIKYAVIPNADGALEIPQFTLEWFDTNSQSAQQTIIPATTLQIEPADISTTQVPKAINFNPTEIPQTQAIPTETISDAASNPGLWQILTAVFGFLWLITLTIYWLHIRKKPKTPQPEKTVQRQVPLKNLNSENPSEAQKALIAWWNEQHHQRVTNLSQIHQQLQHQEAKQAIQQLQESLYGQAETQLQINWQQLVKQGQLAPAKVNRQSTQGLPELYDH